MVSFRQFILVTTTLLATCLVNPFVAAQLADYPVINIEKHKNIGITYNVKDDVLEAGIGKTLYFVRGLLESYKSLNVPFEQLHSRHDDWRHRR